MGDACGLNQAIHYLSFVVGVCPCRQSLVFQCIDFLLEFGRVETIAQKIYIGQGGKDSFEGLRNAEILAGNHFESTSNAAVIVGEEVAGGEGAARPMMGQ